MPQNKYRIYELSARSVMSYATHESGQWHFALDRAATEKCRSFPRFTSRTAMHCFSRSCVFFKETTFQNRQMIGSLRDYPT